MRQATIYLSIFLIGFFGCVKDEEMPESGYFVLREIQNSNFKSSQSFYDELKRTEFLLGDLKASKEFFFLLSNGGENPIFDVNLETDNTQFDIAPENISILSGSNSEGADNVIPLISLGILHGIQLNGVGYTDLLAMGENSTTLTIRGKTIDFGDTIDLESKYIFKVNAKKMDISIHSNGLEIDLLNPTGNAVFGNYGGLGTLRFYRASSDVIEMKNLGNVDINVHRTSLYAGIKTDLGDTSLLQDQSVEIYLPQQFTILTLDSDGTITEDSRIQLGNNGKGYLVIERYFE